MKKIWLEILLCLGFFPFCVPSVNAAPIILNGQLPYFDTLIDFSGYPYGLNLVDQYINQGAYFRSGISTVSTNLTFDSISPVHFPNVNGDVIVNYDPNNIQGPFYGFSIFFTVPVDRAAFQLVTFPMQYSYQTSNFTALLDGKVVEVFSAPGGGMTGAAQYTYFGFTDIIFDQINITPGGFDGRCMMDNLNYSFSQSTSVPDSGTPLYFVIGLASLWLWRRKYKLGVV